MNRLDCIEFAVHQLEQSLLTLNLFGGAATVRHLAELHARIMEDWEESAISSAKAVEAIMEGINVDDNGKKIINPASVA